MSYCTSLGTFTCSPCPTTELGRIRALAIVKRGTPLPDPTSQQDWFNAICSGLAIVIPADQFRGALEVAENTATGYGDSINRTMSFTHTINGFGRYNCENVAFFNELNYASNQFNVWVVTEKSVKPSKVGVNFVAKTPVLEDINSEIEFEFMITFTTREGSLECYDRPTLVFDSCESLASLQACLTCNAVTVDPC